MKTERNPVKLLGLACALALVCGFAAVTVPRAAAAPAPAENLRCEHLADPLGIDVVRPRLSWRLAWPQRGARQTAYRLLVASSPELLARDQGDLWDSGKVESDQSILVEYAGRPLKSEQFCHWKVQAWDEAGRPAPWSAPARWSVGLLDPGGWRAAWIGLDGGEEQAADLLGQLRATWIWLEPGALTSAPAEPRLFRRVLTIPPGRQLRQALCQMAADDGFTLLVNGQEVGGSEGHGSVASLDLTSRLRPGDNVLAVAAYNKPGPPQNPAGLIGALRVEFLDGDPLALVTDGQWRAAVGSVPGWDRPGFDAAGWSAAAVLGVHGSAPWGPVSAGNDHRRLSARMLRREFPVARKVARATAYVCGLGFSEIYLNGRKLDTRVMDPTHSRYDMRAMYVTFDATTCLRAGPNAVGALLGNGRFFAPRVTVPAPTPTFGFPKLLFQLRIEYADGGSDLVVSDENWKLTDQGPIRSNSEFDGEEYDARMEQPGWDMAGFDDSKWQPARKVAAPGGKLIAQMLEPMRVIETLRPVAVTSPGPGVHVADFGQNLYGMVRIKVTGARGTRVAIRTTFDLRPDGMIDMGPNRSALSTDQYTLKGEGLEVWAPRFRGQGIRYAEITGWPGTPTVDDLELLVVHSELEPAGDFSCSNGLVDKIHANLRRTVRMQERGVPMDPDRDERQAWLSVSEMTSETEGYLYKVAAFYQNFLGECRIDQREDGCLSDAGSLWRWSQSGDPCWPAVVIATPWSCYLMYGDRRILADNYPMMKRWVEFLEQRLDPDFIYRKGCYGDWVDAYTMDAATSDHGGTSRELLWTAYVYSNFTRLALIADVLGKPDDAARFRATAGKVGAAFQRTFFEPQTMTYTGKTQTALVLPLAFGLTPPEHRRAVTDNLVNDILVTQLGNLSVGTVGIKWLLQTLTEMGRTDVAYHVLTKTTRPGWGYMIGKGATSIWERWDRDTRDPGMNGQSQTILAGYLGAWLYQTLGGIRYDPSQTGFKHLILRPQPVGDLSFVTASHQSPHGVIRSAWHIDQGGFRWNVTVPANTTATVWVPTTDATAVTEGGKPAAQAAGLRFVRAEPKAAVYEAAAGIYQIDSPWSLADNPVATVPPRTGTDTYYAGCASPGHVLKHDGEYLMFFSASTADARTIGIARTRDLDGAWTPDPQPALPLTPPH